MKNETKAGRHTPGPWRRSLSTIKAANGAHVARIVKGWGVKEAPELLANAALISAAPDILAALIRMEDWAAIIDDEDSRVPADIRIEARAAIVKALGENAE